MCTTTGLACLSQVSHPRSALRRAPHAAWPPLPSANEALAQQAEKWFWLTPFDCDGAISEGDGDSRHPIEGRGCECGNMQEETEPSLMMINKVPLIKP